MRTLMHMVRMRERERYVEAVELDDSALLRHAAGGDGAAFDELYRRHAEAAMRVAYAVATNQEDAADAVSDSFIKVLRVVQEGRFPPGLDFRPYLLVAARNCALDVARARARHRRAIEREIPTAQGVVAAPGSAEAVLDGVDAQLVASAFARLPERWRSVLWFTEVEGVPAREVAPIMGLSANGVAQLAVRARNGLRTAYLQVHLQGQVKPACRPFVADLGAYVGGVLTIREVAKVDQHLAACKACRARRDELDDLRTTLRRIAFPLPVALAAGIAARWKLIAEGASVAARVSSSARAVTRVAPDGLERMRNPLTAGAAALAAAGIMFLGVHDAAAPPSDSDQAGSPRASVRAPQAIVDGFDLRLAPVRTRLEDDGLLTASPRLGTSPSPAVARLPGSSGSPPSSNNPPGSAPAPKQPVPLAQADVGAPALGAQASVGSGPGSCTSVELTLLAVGDCPPPSGSGPVNTSVGGSLLGGG